MLMQLHIARIPGDGIGPEIIESASAVLDAVAQKYGHKIQYRDVIAGGAAIDRFGEPLPQAALDACLASDAVLLGALGGPKWDTLPGHLRPERALLGLRKGLGLFANLRPAVLYPSLQARCPLKNLAQLDLLIVRELTGGIYFGARGRRQSEMGEEAFDTECYSEQEVLRIGKLAFAAARNRKQRLTSIDKANVMESSRLWREVMHRLAEEYPDVQYDDMLVDNAAMQLIRNPAQFDVIVTSNMFGDILSDEASQLTGSIGLLASASLGEHTRGMYEPIHGSAPDIAGQGIANPLATVLSAAMLLRHSFLLESEAQCIEEAVQGVLAQGELTPDLGGEIGTRETTRRILEQISQK